VGLVRRGRFSFVLALPLSELHGNFMMVSSRKQEKFRRFIENKKLNKLKNN
jgi:hypothetical protein